MKFGSTQNPRIHFVSQVVIFRHEESQIFLCTPWESRQLEWVSSHTSKRPFSCRIKTCIGSRSTYFLWSGRFKLIIVDMLTSIHRGIQWRWLFPSFSLSCREETLEWHSEHRIHLCWNELHKGLSQNTGDKHTYLNWSNVSWGLCGGWAAVMVKMIRKPYVLSSIAPTRMYPALLTRTSILPWISTAFFATSWRVSSGDVTSNSMISAPFTLRSSSFAIDRERPVAITFSPRFKASKARSRPSPELHWALVCVEDLKSNPTST